MHARHFLLGSLVLALGCTPPASIGTKPVNPASSGTTAAAQAVPSLPSFADQQNAKYVSLKIPDMMCPHGCWPQVKESLEGQKGVELVELAKQKQEDEIDNPMVFVKLNGEFDAALAIKSLSQLGFTGQVADEASTSL